MNIRAEFKVGKNNKNDWSGVYGYRPDITSDIQTELFCVLRVKSDANGIDLETFAKMLLDEFQDSYYSFSTTEDEIIKLEESLQRMKTKLEVIVSREDEVLEKGLDLEMVISLINNDTLVVGVVGEAKVLIYREEKIVDISKGLVDANLMGFVKTGSLKLMPRDRVAILTKAPYENEYISIENSIKNLEISESSTIEKLEGSAFMLIADETAEWENLTKQKNISALNTNSENTEESVDLPQFNGDLRPDDYNGFNTNNPDTNFEPIEGDNIEGHIDNVLTEEGEEYLSDEIKDSTGINTVNSRLSLVSNKVTGLFSNVKSKFKKGSFKNNNFESSSNSLDNKYIPIEDTNDNSYESENSEYINTQNSNSRFSKFKPNFDENNLKTYQKIIKDILSNIKRLITKLVDLIRYEIIGVPDRTNMANHASRISRNRKILLIVLVVLVVAVYFVIKDANEKRFSAEQLEEARIEFSQLESDSKSAISQVDSVKTQDISKRELLESKLNSYLTEIESQRVTALFNNELASLELLILKALDSLNYVIEVNDNNINVVSDIGKFFSDTNLTDMVFANNQIYVSDSKRNVIYSLLTSTNSNPTEVVSGLNTPNILTKDSSNNIVVFDNDVTSAVGRLNTTSNEFVRVTGLSPAVIGSVNEAEIYTGNDAIYEIHQNHQQIFKRDVGGTGFVGGGSIYVSVNPPNWRTDSEFANAIDIDIPYEIYVLIQGQGLKRYLAGEGNTLTYEIFSNLSQSDYDTFKNATSFDIDGNYLAVGDSENNRVMLFTIEDNEQKNIKFVQQYNYRGEKDVFGDIEEISIDFSKNTIYILDGTKIVSLSV